MVSLRETSLVAHTVKRLSIMRETWVPSLGRKDPLEKEEFSKFAGILSAALSQHHLSGFGIAELEFHHLH